MDGLVVTTTAPGAPTGLPINLSEGPNPYAVSLFDLQQQQDIGFTVGLGIVSSNRFSAGIEWRFITESAFYTNFQVSF